MHGWSYGGYLALTALYRWPEVFAAGSTHAGMSDLLSFFAETGAVDGRCVDHRVRRPACAGRPAAGAVAAHPPRAGASRPPCWCTATGTPTCPCSNRSGLTPRCAPAGVPTGLLLLPGEGHTVVGAGHRAELALAVSSWYAYWLDPARRRPGRP